MERRQSQGQTPLALRAPRFCRETQQRRSFCWEPHGFAPHLEGIAGLFQGHF